MANDFSESHLEPFGVSPDSWFIYFNTELRLQHEALLAALAEGKSLVLVTGARGIGKTILLRSLAVEIEALGHLAIFMSCQGNPTIDDILTVLGARMGLPRQAEGATGPGDSANARELSNLIRLNQTRLTLFLDDADTLPIDLASKLLAMLREGIGNGSSATVVMAGSPDLRRGLENLEKSRRIKQDIDLSISLTPLSKQDVEPYILHRLHIAEFSGGRVFSSEAIDRIAYYSAGNPQAINRICRAALVFAASQSSETVSTDIVEQVAPSGGGARVPEGVMLKYERLTPQADAESDRFKRPTASASSPHQSMLPEGDIAETAPKSTGSSQANYNNEDDDGQENGESGENLIQSSTDLPFREVLKIQTLPDTESVPAGKKGFGKTGRTALFVLLALGSILLYFVGTGRIKDILPAIKELPAAAKVQEPRVGDAESGSANRSLPTAWVEPPRDIFPEAQRPKTSVASGKASFDLAEPAEAVGDHETSQSVAVLETHPPEHVVSPGGGSRQEKDGTASARSNLANGDMGDPVDPKKDVSPSESAAGTEKAGPLTTGEKAPVDQGVPLSAISPGESRLRSDRVSPDVDPPRANTEQVSGAVSSRDKPVVGPATDEPPRESGELNASPDALSDGPEPDLSVAPSDRAPLSGKADKEVDRVAPPQTRSDVQVTVPPGGADSALPSKYPPLPEPTTPDTTQMEAASPPLPGPMAQGGQTAKTTARQLNLNQLIVRGDSLISLGDVASARLVYRLAAAQGSALAASAMGSTYDPIFLESNGLQETQANPERALEWYRQAIVMGAEDADNRRRALTVHLKSAAERGDPEAIKVLQERPW